MEGDEEGVIALLLLEILVGGEDEVGDVVSVSGVPGDPVGAAGGDFDLGWAVGFAEGGVGIDDGVDAEGRGLVIEASGEGVEGVAFFSDVDAGARIRLAVGAVLGVGWARRGKAPSTIGFGLSRRGGLCRGRGGG